MGAYYHIFAPIKILVVVSKEKIENNNFLSFLPEKYRDDFILSHRQDYTQSSPSLPNGNILKWEKSFLTFCLKPELLKEVKEFILDCLDMAKHKLYTCQSDIDGISNVIKNFDNIAIDTDRLATDDNYPNLLDKELSTIAKNYYLRYENKVMNNAVYTGVPEEFRSDSFGYGFGGFIVCYSKNKYMEYSEEALLFEELKQKIQNDNNYSLSKFILNLCY